MRVLRFERDELPNGHMGTFEVFVINRHVRIPTFNDKNRRHVLHQLNVPLSDDLAANSSKIFRVLYFRVILLRCTVATLHPHPAYYSPHSVLTQ